MLFDLIRVQNNLEFFFKGLGTLGGSQLDCTKSVTKPSSLMKLICSCSREVGSTLLGN